MDRNDVTVHFPSLLPPLLPRGRSRKTSLSKEDLSGSFRSPSPSFLPRDRGSGRGTPFGSSRYGGSSVRCSVYVWMTYGLGIDPDLLPFYLYSDRSTSNFGYGLCLGPVHLSSSNRPSMSLPKDLLHRSVGSFSLSTGALLLLANPSGTGGEREVGPKRGPHAR